MLARGTDYTTLRPFNHPIQPPVEIVIKTVEEARRKWSCDKIFLATEDYSIVERFKDRFKDDCVITNRPYVEYKKYGAVSNCHIERENDYFLLGKEYLTDMVILSKCQCLATSICSGSVGMMMMSGGFENCVVFDLGIYGIKR